MADLEHPLVVAADWAVAVVLVLGGAVAWRWSRPTAVLLGAAGAAWVLGGLLPAALFWHRALLVHALLAYPGWRPSSSPAGAVVVLTYLTCLVAPAALLAEPVNVILGLGALAAAGWNLRGARGVARHRRRVALRAALVLAAALLVGSALRQYMTSDASALTLGLYELGVVVAAVALLAGLRPPPAEVLTDLVVDLGQSRAMSLRDALARTLRDPDLRLGFWDDAAAAYLDDFGSALDPVATPGRAPVLIDRDREPIAMLLLDEGLAGDPQVVDSIRTATRIAAVNAQRHRELLGQLRELQQSRRRLLSAADDERRRLEWELRAGVLSRLSALVDDLRAVRAEGPASPSPHLERGLGHLERSIDDLVGVAGGLRPTELAQGLTAALASLAEESPVDLSVEAPVGSWAEALTPEVELTIWYVCAEAITNIAKHAPGASAMVIVSCPDGGLQVRVTDDGPGGAAYTPRGGLLGLRDRVEAVGGRLQVNSSSAGTVLVVDLPVPTNEGGP